jgi:hypothetical protein
MLELDVSIHLELIPKLELGDSSPLELLAKLKLMEIELEELSKMTLELDGSNSLELKS